MMVTPTVMVMMMVMVVPMTALLFTLPHPFLTLFSRCFFQRALQRQPLFLVETFQNFLHVCHDVTATFVGMPCGIPSRPHETLLIIVERPVRRRHQAGDGFTAGSRPYVKSNASCDGARAAQS
jgi:hypothetical protein